MRVRRPVPSILAACAAALALGCEQAATSPDSAPGSADAARIAGAGGHGGTLLTADLTGAAEAPGPGDPDGTGSARVTLNHGQREVCFELQVADITLPAAAAHIHRGAAGVPGPIVVFLAPPGADGSAVGCREGVDRGLIKEIRKSPAAFYVNVHTSDFPAGAVRGQLSK